MADSKQYLTEVGDKIQRVYSPKLIDLLICRFIKGMTQEQTAEKNEYIDAILEKTRKTCT